MNDPWAAELEKRERELVRRRAYRARRMQDPEYRAKVNAYHRAYNASHPEIRIAKRDWKRRWAQRKWERENPPSLHELACKGPRSAEGCSCQEVILASIRT